jgi:hypothetical protein
MHPHHAFAGDGAVVANDWLMDYQRIMKVVDFQHFHHPLKPCWKLAINAGCRQTIHAAISFQGAVLPATGCDPAAK